MGSLDIGVTGINAAQRGIEVVGNNIANAATEGYHRQEINFKPAFSITQGQFVFGQGVEINDVYRVVDKLLNNEITRQFSAYNQQERELIGLQTLETSFAELNSNALSEKMDDFFQAIEEFSKQPQSEIYENKVVNTAVTLTNQLNHMGEIIASMQESIRLEANTLLNKLNQLSESFAYLNSRIVAMEASGVKANDLRNERDQIINKMSELIEIETAERRDGSVDISIRSSGSVVVVGGAATLGFAAEPIDESTIGLKVHDSNEISTEITGGSLGGLFRLNNEYLNDIKDKLDTMVATITNEFNKIHLQGVGADGSFSQLSGWSVSDEPLSQWSNVTVPGKIYVRMTNTATGEITRHSIDIDGTDTLATVAAKFNGASVPNLDASVNGSVLNLQAQSGYKFDFLPGVISEPTTDMATGTSAVTVSGTYTGDKNQTYTGTITGSGRVGVDSGLSLEITNGLGQVVKTVDIGQGFVAGEEILFDNGLSVSLGVGTVINGETFTIEALANSDETGFLAASGINCFFEGDNSRAMKVCSEVVNGDRRMAASIGPDMSDNENLKRLYGVYDTTYTALNNSSIRPYYQSVITDLGQKIQTSTVKRDGLGAVLKNLNEKHEEISGVDVNTEATKLMMFEQMFQAMSRYLSVCKETMDEIAYIL